ncbi:LOW QUALITY PROTEIN: diacylglycerol O-acyltransferase 1-like [Emys orbicularis]|uniref:LOW QUALITY PROTEIN: diacylglycerol O-acyltransferase 1-like n=1 Tax=Emys orbicularis TaxID=82168 RepID=UPI0031FC3963
MDRCGRRERGWRGACCLMTLAGAAGNRQRRGVEARGRGPTGGGACEGFGIKMSGKRKKKINISINPEMPQPEMNDTEVRQDDPERLSCHTLCESLLSYGSGFNNFQGIFNWSVVLLVLTHVHMSLENFIRYGLLFDPVKIISVFLKDPYKWPAVYLIAVSVLFALPAVFIERYLRKVRGSESIGLVLQSVNLFLLVIFPAVMVYRMQAITPAGGLLTMFVYIIITLKLFSYYQVNRWYREGTPRPVRGTSRMQAADPSAHQSRRNERGQSKQIMYPMNLKVKDLYYFLLAPTLCYQLNFPRQKNCRQGYIIRRFIEMIFLFHLMLGLIQQWIVPNIHKSMKPINEIESTLLTEYILKLAVPNHFIWLIFFYWYFHSCLNCLAELLRFGDRQFYLDWWNADSVLQFWSRWNIPAHKWLDRHVYRPLLHHGYDKWQARMTVFLLSACFYEYLIAIPLKMFRFWMFFAMAAQVPLACLMKRLFGGNFGNIFMWISLVLGPPLMMLLYFHDYYIQHHRKDSSWRLFFF